MIGNSEKEVGGIESVERGLGTVPVLPWRYVYHGVWVIGQHLTVTGKKLKHSLSLSLKSLAMSLHLN